MKAVFSFLPALLLAVAVSTVYTVRAVEEKKLTRRVALSTAVHAAPAITAKPAEYSSGFDPSKPLPDAAIKIVPLSRAQGEQLMAKLIAEFPPDAAEMPVKIRAYCERLKHFSPEELAALCATQLSSDQRLEVPHPDDTALVMLKGDFIMEACNYLRVQPPAVILRLFEGLDPLNLKGGSHLLRDSLREMAATDADAAWAWILRQPDGPLRLETRKAVLEGASGGDAFAWLELVEKYGAPEVVMSGSRTALEHPAFREAWVEKVIAYRGEGAALDLQKFAAETHDVQGFAAARDFVTQHPELPERDEAIRAVATGHLIRNGVEKADWLVAETSPENLRANTEALMKAWTARDPAGAAEWLNAAPAAAPWRDIALKAFAEAVAPHDAEAALTFAERIGDVTMREAATKEVSE